MSSRPSPAKVRSVLARIRKVEHWLDSCDWQIEEGDTNLGAIGYNETDAEFRNGVRQALAWVAGEYDDGVMPRGISRLIQHTNKREFMKLLKEHSDAWERGY